MSLVAIRELSLQLVFWMYQLLICGSEYVKAKADNIFLAVPRPLGRGLNKTINRALALIIFDVLHILFDKRLFYYYLNLS